MKGFDWKRLLPHILAVLIFLVLSVIYTKPALEGKVVEQHDVKEWKAMAQQSFEVKAKTGYFPRWTNSMFCGMPTYQITMDSKKPAYINVYYFHLALTFGLPKPVYYLFLCCLGFYFLCVVLGVNPWLSIAGGIAYGYCSYDPILITAGHDTKLLSIAYVPAVLASLQLLFEKKYWIGGAILIITLNCLLGQSHQQIAYYLLLAAVLMSIPFLITTIRNKDFKHILVVFGFSLTAVVVSVCFVSTSYFPIYEYSKETMRGGGSGLTLGNTAQENKTKGGLDKDYAFNWSYGKAETFTLLVPNAFGGGSATSLGEDGKVMNLLQSESNIPPQMGQQLAQAASAYWGEQPSTSGPVYIGGFICVLAVAGFVASANKNKWWLLGVVILGIVLAWGKNLAGVNYFLFDYLPFYKKFRAPSMSLVMAQLALPAMAILFVDEFIKTEKEKQLLLFKKLLLVAGGTLALLLGFYFFADFTNANTLEIKKSLLAVMKDNTEFVNNFMKAWQEDRKTLYLKDMLRSLAFIGITVAAMYAVPKKIIQPSLLIVVLIAVAIIDLLPIGKRYFNDDNFVDADTYEQAYATTAADEQLKSDTSFYRVCNLAFYNGGGYVADIGNSFNSAIASYHHNTIGGYHPAKLSIFEDIKNYQIFKNIQAWATNSNAKDSFPVLNMLNMKYVIVPNQSNPKQTLAIKNPFALGNCWFVKQVQIVHSADEEMKAMDHFNPATTAFINDGFTSIVSARFTYDSTATIRLIKNNNDYIKYESDARTNQFAVFSEIYYSQGWDAYVDGKKSDYCKANYVLRAMPLPAGKHTIEFKFEPKLVDLGEQLSFYGGILSVLLVLLFLFLEWNPLKTK